MSAAILSRAHKTPMPVPLLAAENGTTSRHGASPSNPETTISPAARSSAAVTTTGSPR